jgi:hypothetical protein
MPEKLSIPSALPIHGEIVARHPAAFFGEGRERDGCARVHLALFAADAQVSGRGAHAEREERVEELADQVGLG